MKMRFVYTFAFIFLSVIISCKKAEVKPAFDENIKIKMTETVDNVKRILNLNCYTEKIFECSNYGIETTYSLTEDKITINFIKIITPNICLTSLGPASTVVRFNALANKLYAMELNFGATKITGQLNVTTGSFVATLPVTTKVQLVNPDLKRIPDNTIYGTVHYRSDSTSTLVQKFIDTLQLYGATPTLYPQGDYVQFQIEGNGQIKQIQDIGYNFTRYYIFNYSNNSGQLRDLVKRFGMNYSALLLITLNTTKGETFYSWRQ